MPVRAPSGAHVIEPFGGENAVTGKTSASRSRPDRVKEAASSFPVPHLSLIRHRHLPGLAEVSILKDRSKRPCSNSRRLVSAPCTDRRRKCAGNRGIRSTKLYEIFVAIIQAICPSLFQCSTGCLSPVDRQQHAGYMPGFPRAQKQGGIGDIDGFGQTLQRHALAEQIARRVQIIANGLQGIVQ